MAITWEDITGVETVSPQEAGQAAFAETQPQTSLYSLPIAEAPRKLQNVLYQARKRAIQEQFRRPDEDRNLWEKIQEQWRRHGGFFSSPSEEMNKGFAKIYKHYAKNPDDPNARQALDMFTQIRDTYEQALAADPVEGEGHLKLLQDMFLEAIPSVPNMVQFIVLDALPLGLALIPEPATTAAGTAMLASRGGRIASLLGRAGRAYKGGLTARRAVEAGKLTAAGVKWGQRARRVGQIGIASQVFFPEHYSEIVRRAQKADVDPKIANAYGNVGAFVSAAVETVIGPGELIGLGGSATLTKGAGNALWKSLHGSIGRTTARFGVERVVGFLGEWGEEGMQGGINNLAAYLAAKADDDPEVARSLLQSINDEIHKPANQSIEGWNRIQTGWDVFIDGAKQHLKESWKGVGGIMLITAPLGGISVAARARQRSALEARADKAGVNRQDILDSSADEDAYMEKLRKEIDATNEKVKKEKAVEKDEQTRAKEAEAEEDLRSRALPIVEAYVNDKREPDINFEPDLAKRAERVHIEDEYLQLLAVMGEEEVGRLEDDAERAKPSGVSEAAPEAVETEPTPTPTPSEAVEVPPEAPTGVSEEPATVEATESLGEYQDKARRLSEYWAAKEPLPSEKTVEGENVQDINRRQNTARARQFEQLSRKPVLTDKDKADINKQWKAHKKEIEAPPVEEDERLRDTTVVDDEGAPLRVFHGTRDADLTADQLDPGSGFETRDVIFFTSNENIASQFTFEREFGELVTERPTGEVDEYEGEIYEDIEPGPILSAYLSIKNPLVLEEDEAQEAINDTALQGRLVKQAKERGYDGIIFRDVVEFADPSERGDVYGVFDKSQIVPEATPEPTPARVIPSKLESVRDVFERLANDGYDEQTIRAAIEYARLLVETGITPDDLAYMLTTRDADAETYASEALGINFDDALSLAADEFYTRVKMNEAGEFGGTYSEGQILGNIHKGKSAGAVEPTPAEVQPEVAQAPADTSLPTTPQGLAEEPPTVAEAATVEAELTPEPTIAEQLNAGEKIRLPKGANGLRVTDAEGRTSTVLKKDMDTLAGAGPFTKVVAVNVKNDTKGRPKWAEATEVADITDEVVTGKFEARRRETAEFRVTKPVEPEPEPTEARAEAEEMPAEVAEAAREFTLPPGTTERTLTTPEAKPKVGKDAWKRWKAEGSEKPFGQWLKERAEDYRANAIEDPEFIDEMTREAGELQEGGKRGDWFSKLGREIMAHANTSGTNVLKMFGPAGMARWFSDLVEAGRREAVVWLESRRFQRENRHLAQEARLDEAIQIKLSDGRTIRGITRDHLIPIYAIARQSHLREALAAVDEGGEEGLMTFLEQFDEPVRTQIHRPLVGILYAKTGWNPDAEYEADGKTIKGDWEYALNPDAKDIRAQFVTKREGDYQWLSARDWMDIVDQVESMPELVKYVEQFALPAVNIPGIMALNEMERLFGIRPEEIQSYFPQERLFHRRTAREAEVHGETSADITIGGKKMYGRNTLVELDLDKKPMFHQRQFAHAGFIFRPSREVIQRAVSDGARYVGYNEIVTKWKGLLESFRRTDGVPLRDILNSQHGEAFYNQFRDDLISMEGSIDREPSKMERRLAGLLHVSARVILQQPRIWLYQPVSMFSYAVHFGWQPFMQALAMRATPEGRAVIQRVREISPDAELRYVMNRVENLYLTESRYKNQAMAWTDTYPTGRFKRGRHTLAKVSNKLLRPMVGADRIAIDMGILTAYNRVKEQNPGMTEEELIERAAFEASTAMHMTQVSANPLNMTGFRRGKTWWAKGIGFMTGATSAAYNVAARAIIAVHQNPADQTAWLNVASASLALTTQAVIIGAIKAMIGRKPDADDDDVQRLIQNIMDSMVNYLPAAGPLAPQILYRAAQVLNSPDMKRRYGWRRKLSPHQYPFRWLETTFRGINQLSRAEQGVVRRQGKEYKMSRKQQESLRKAGMKNIGEGLEQGANLVMQLNTQGIRKTLTGTVQRYTQ